MNDLQGNLQVIINKLFYKDINYLIRNLVKHEKKLYNEAGKPALESQNKKTFMYQTINRL